MTGTITLLFLRIFKWSWISFKAFSTEWVLLVIGDMIFGRDVSLYIVFFS